MYFISVTASFQAGSQYYELLLKLMNDSCKFQGYIAVMSRNYKFHNPSGIYFVSFATVFWVDVFIRQVYFDALAESIIYCRKYKGMEVYAYCFMPSHVHLVFRSNRKDPAGLIRDYKGFTSRKLLKLITENPKESRKEWLLRLFKQAAKTKKNVTYHQFWQQHNQPIELWSTKVIRQKINYIHKNPVLAGFVMNPMEWKYSSAKNYAGELAAVEIERIGYLEL